ncbi:unnamed protein product [Mytilus edulis]|uniref:Transcriptional coactivator p15 (PC4) C-terminal domain-containing protein n=1 Tax=Mytilus edulis TaxID=6550 RepID=A0A8S3RZB3_MYTED|nr:unnamed protein product [Mytilus edulis]
MSLPNIESIEYMPENIKFWDKSLSSSLSNLYQHFNIHISILKWIGAISILVLTASTLTVSTNLYNFEKSLPNSSNDINVNNLPSFNDTICRYMKLFRLPGEYFVTVCKYDNNIHLDIRQLLNNKPTIKGVTLTIDQWKYLQSIRQYINRATEEARHQ